MLETFQEIQKAYLSNFNASYKRYLYRHISFDEKLIGVYGAKGVGKTTLLLQYFQDVDIAQNQKLYLSVDSIELESIFKLVDEFSKTGGKLLILDNIHKYIGFKEELKEIYNKFDLQVIFATSSFGQVETLENDMKDKVRTYHLKGLSFREFCEQRSGEKLPSFHFEDILNNHVKIAVELLVKFDPSLYWNEYLEYGFYPFHLNTEYNNSLYLKEIVNKTLEVDISYTYGIELEQIIEFKKIIRLVYKSQLNNLKNNELKKLRGYIDYLNKENILNTSLDRDKFYLANSNLYYALHSSTSIQTIREAFFISQFEKNQINSIQNNSFLIDNIYNFEIIGNNKNLYSLNNTKHSFVVADNLEIGMDNKIPIWLFGFLY